MTTFCFQLFSRLYYSVTGWGSVGPRKDTIAFDTTAFFAAGGIMDSLGQRDSPPIKPLPGQGGVTSTSVYRIDKNSSVCDSCVKCRGHSSLGHMHAWSEMNAKPTICGPHFCLRGSPNRTRHAEFYPSRATPSTENRSRQSVRGSSQSHVGMEHE